MRRRLNFSVRFTSYSLDKLYPYLCEHLHSLQAWEIFCNNEEGFVIKRTLPKILINVTKWKAEFKPDCGVKIRMVQIHEAIFRAYP